MLPPDRPVERGTNSGFYEYMLRIEKQVDNKINTRFIRVLELSKGSDKDMFGS